MNQDCVMVAAKSLTSELEQVHFRYPRWLNPIKKCAGPFRYYALYCFVQTSPAALNGDTAIIVAVGLSLK